MTFPSTSDYALAVRYPDRFVLDPVLRQGRAVLGRDGDPLIYSGGFARVFLFEGADGRRYALRCWTSDCGDSYRTYREAHLHLEKLRLPHFADFSITNPGIIAGGKHVPTVRMTWVEGETLKDFLAKHLRAPKRIAHVRQRFAAACAVLHQHRIAHGDLQPENLKLVGPEGREEVVFIDYDTLHVPALTGTQRVIDGLPAYQHPRRAADRTVQAHDDYFSELVLYLSLLAFERRPALWDRWRVGDRDKELLFNEADYRACERSPILAELEGIDAELAGLVVELRAACRVDTPARLEPLEAVLARVASRRSPPVPAGPTKARAQGGSVFEARLRGQKVSPPPLPPPDADGPPEFTQPADAAGAKPARPIDWSPSADRGRTEAPSSGARGTSIFSQRAPTSNTGTPSIASAPPAPPASPAGKRLGFARAFALWVFVFFIALTVMSATVAGPDVRVALAVCAASAVTGMVVYAYRD